jgi:hypothetical protein
MTTDNEYMAQCQQLAEIQALLDEAYQHYFDNSDGYCKSSEGYVEVRFNNYFDRRDGQPLKITGVGVYSYVLGPSRMHDFDSVEAALTAVRQWHAKEMVETYE